jgi:hypothetical protein
MAARLLPPAYLTSTLQTAKDVKLLTVRVCDRTVGAT